MKKFIIIALILSLIIFSGIVYLNKVFLPQKIKSIIVSNLAQHTRKNVTLGSLEFNIFKGLVLHDLVIADSQNVILSTRQATCGIFIWPVFKKQIIISSINFKSPYIFIERFKDGSFNLQDIFISSPAVVKMPELKESKSKKSEFSVSVYKINVSSGIIVFQDDTLAVQFKKEIRNIQLSLGLALPVSVKFNFKGEIPNNPPAFVFAWGEYKILNPELAVNLSVNNLLPMDFEAYYSKFGLNLLSGLVDGQVKLNFKGQLLNIEADAKAAKLVFAKEKVKVSLNLDLQSKINYNLQTNKVSFDGSCDLQQADISGLGFFGELKNLYGKIAFNERSLVAQGLKAELLGMPFEVNLGIKDFSTLALNINTSLNLSFLPVIAKEKFNFSHVSSALGKAALFLKLHPDGKGGWVIQGKVEIVEAGLKLAKENIPVENISATLEFSQQGFSWSDTKFKYQDMDYQSSGELSDFSTPNIKLQLSSRDLSLVSAFGITDNKIKITQAKGKYLDSQFLISANIDNSDPLRPQVDVNGKINLDLEDLNKLLAKQYPVIKDMQSKGKLDTQFTLSGPIYDFKNCLIQAKLSSNNLSLYGLRTQDFVLDYLQEQKIAKISAMRIVFYDGLIDGFASLNLDTATLPYHLELQANGVKLEKLKLDTPSKNKNISGTFQGEVKLNGFSKELNKLSGAGQFSVKEGRLWELNLLQGMGKLLFAKDLGSIELSECTCSFLVKDKFFFTDSLRLKSNIAELFGSLKIGFDSSLEGAIDVDILSEMIPLSGSLKDVTTAFMGQMGKIGVIKLSGKLDAPKYNFKPAVANIVKGLTDIIFGKQR
jgi:Protein of unknown function